MPVAARSAPAWPLATVFSPAMLLCCAVLAGSALAADDGVHGYALASLTQTHARSTAANPDKLFDAGGGSAELALGLEGSAGGLRWRARLTLDGERGSSWPGRRGIELQELHYGWRLGERWHVSAGQQLLTWDNGLAYQPLGFFKSSRTDLRDVFDTEGRSQGLPMAVATHLGDSVTTELVASVANPGGERAGRLNARQLAVRWSGEPLPGLNTAFMLRKRDGARLGAGISASYGVDEITLRGDAYYGPAEARTFPLGLFDGIARLFTPPPAFTFDPGHAYKLRSVLGATWTPLRGVALHGEWIHHGDGLSGGAWRRYRV
ncbi:MAG TPA: hypothetical protein VF774_08905, partial [Pseudoduganella sp.]